MSVVLIGPMSQCANCGRIPPEDTGSAALTVCTGCIPSWRKATSESAGGDWVSGRPKRV